MLHVVLSYNFLVDGMYVGIPVICGLWTIPNWDARPRSQTPLVNHRVPHCWSWSLVSTWSDIPYFTSCSQMHISNISRFEIQKAYTTSLKSLERVLKRSARASVVCTSCVCLKLLGKAPNLMFDHDFPFYPITMLRPWKFTIFVPILGQNLFIMTWWLSWVP
jgi:hypothetical protein